MLRYVYHLSIMSLYRAYSCLCSQKYLSIKFVFFLVQAEKWVSNMTRTMDDKSTRVVLEARPPGLVLLNSFISSL